MGASKYRWFHEYGCCQCIGSTCLDYGLNEPNCLRCPSKKEEEDKEKWLPEFNDFVGGSEESSVKNLDGEEAVKLLPDIVPDTL